MRKLVTITAVLMFLVFMAVPGFSQDIIAEGYTKILELNEFDGSPHWPVPADEVHAGFDLDKDGNLEFIFLADHSNPNGPSGGWSDGHSVYVYEWNGSAFEKMWSWADTSLKTGGASFPTMAIADLDGDGNQEIVLGMPSGSGWPAEDVSPTVIYVFEFSTDGGPDAPTASWTANSDPGSNTRPSGMAAGDIDGDGVQEVAVGFRAFSTASTNDALMIFSIDGGFAGDFTQFKVEMIDTTGDWGSVYAVDITDLDNDGNLEAYFSTDNHTIYEASGADTYTLNYSESSEINLGPWTIQGTVQADIDGDGTNELVWGHWSSGALRILRNVTDVATIDSTNEAEIKVIEPNGCRGLTVGDFDKDGKTDIFLGGNYAGNVWHIEYNGTGDIADSNSYTYKMVYQDTVPLGDTRVYSVSFPGDNIGLKQGGTSYTDMNKNGKPELLIAYEDGDSLQSWIVMIELDSVMTGIAIEPGRQVLKTYKLHQNYPNPFNPTTMITYEVPTSEKIVLRIYDVLGREVKTLVNRVVPAGKHTVSWDGTNSAGSKVSSGVYIYSLEVGSHKLHKRMTLMK